MRIFKSIFHNTQYYETDSMKIVHHSNYVKWMEEARLNFFKEIGFNWKELESTNGLMIPVLFQSVEYKSKIEFDEVVEIRCVCNKFNGVKMNFLYYFYTQDGNILNAVGVTKHGFIDVEYQPVNLKDINKRSFYVLNECVNE